MPKRLLKYGCLPLLFAGASAWAWEDPPKYPVTLSESPRMQLLVGSANEANGVEFEPLHPVDWEPLTPAWVRAIDLAHPKPDELSRLRKIRSEYDDASIVSEVPLPPGVSPGFFYAFTPEGTVALKPARAKITTAFFFTPGTDQLDRRVDLGFVVAVAEPRRKLSSAPFVLSVDAPLKITMTPTVKAGITLTEAVLKSAPPGRPKGHELEITVTEAGVTRKLVQPLDHPPKAAAASLLTLGENGPRFLFVQWIQDDEFTYGCADNFSLFTLDGPLRELAFSANECDA